MLKTVQNKYPDMAFTPKQVESIAIDIFGEDRVGIMYNDFLADNSFSLIIRFPEIEISNSLNKKHTIKDIFVRFTIKILMDAFDTDDYKSYIELTGTRRTFRLDECESLYVHSHLPKRSYNFSKFCLGSSNFSLCIENLKQTLDKDAWYMVLYSLRGYLEWESLEGGPHTQIRDILYLNSIGDSSIKKELQKIAKDIPYEVWEFNDKLNIIPLHESLHGYFNKASSVRSVYNYSEDTAKNYIESSETMLTNNYDRIIWKGEEVPFKVYYDHIKSDSIDPKIIERYCNILEGISDKFLKQKEYDQRKSQNRKKIFGEVRVI